MNSKLKTLVVLGSGATADGFKLKIDGKSFDPPMDKNFFDTPLLHKAYNQEKFPALHFFQNLQTRSSLEETWSDIDICSKLTNCNGIDPVLTMKHDYNTLRNLFEKKAQVDPTFMNNLACQKEWVGEDGSVGPLADWEARGLIVKLFENLQLTGDAALLKIFEYILNTSDLKGIATFNYDLSVELIWKVLSPKKKLSYLDPYKISGSVKDSIPFYKLHGSINWSSKFSPNCPWTHIVPEDVNESVVESDYVKGGFVDKKPDSIIEAAIIPPVSFKQNISLDLQNDSRSMLFKSIWRKFWKDLLEIDVLAFIGFSFPETDYHAKALFGAAHRRRPFTKVIVNTKTDQSLGRYYSIFGKNTVISFTGGVQNMVNKKEKLISLLKL